MKQEKLYLLVFIVLLMTREICGLSGLDSDQSWSWGLRAVTLLLILDTALSLSSRFSRKKKDE